MQETGIKVSGFSLSEADGIMTLMYGKLVSFDKRSSISFLSELDQMTQYFGDMPWEFHLGRPGLNEPSANYVYLTDGTAIRHYVENMHEDGSSIVVLSPQYSVNTFMRRSNDPKFADSQQRFETLKERLDIFYDVKNAQL